MIKEKGRLYTTGSNEYFQLGHQKADKRFNEVERINEPVKYVSCGAGHTVFSTADGYVYSMGDGSKGQLGLGNEILSAKTPKQIRSLEKYVVIKISSGECHTAFITSNNIK